MVVAIAVVPPRIGGSRGKSVAVEVYAFIFYSPLSSTKRQMAVARPVQVWFWFWVGFFEHPSSESGRNEAF